MIVFVLFTRLSGSWRMDYYWAIYCVIIIYCLLFDGLKRMK